MPFQNFTQSRPQSITNPADEYLHLETSVLNKIRNVRLSSNSYSAEQETKSYELHQQRIINTLNTIDQSDLNLRLEFISLYLQASKNRINQESAPIEKEVLIDKTIKFLEDNLIPPKENSFPSKEAAQKYRNKLGIMMGYMQPLNKSTSLLSKNELRDIILKQSEALIKVKNLQPTSKYGLLGDNDLKSILEAEQIVELKNELLKNLLGLSDFSNLFGSSDGSTDPKKAKTAAREEMLRFVQQQDVNLSNYNRGDLFSIMLENLKESKNNRTFFFKFLNEMLEKTPEIFTQFQNSTISNHKQGQFKEFKTLVLHHLQQPPDETSGLPLVHIDMGKSLIRLMQFKDNDIKEAATAFYLEAIEGATQISCINRLLEPLHSMMQSLLSKDSSVYDSIPLTKEDLTDSLYANSIIEQKRIEYFKQTRLESGKKPPQGSTSDFVMQTLKEYAKTLKIDLENII
jgi:hypothetical protein